MRTPPPTTKPTSTPPFRGKLNLENPPNLCSFGIPIETYPTNAPLKRKKTDQGLVSPGSSSGLDPPRGQRPLRRAAEAEGAGAGPDRQPGNAETQKRGNAPRGGASRWSPVPSKESHAVQSGSLWLLGRNLGIPQKEATSWTV